MLDYERQPLEGEMPAGTKFPVYLTKDLVVQAELIYWPSKKIKWPKVTKTFNITRSLDNVKVDFKYLGVYSGNDTETTNVIKEDYKRAYTYHFQVTLVTEEGGYIFICRKWEEYIDLLDAIADHYKTDERRRLILWDCNLGFEWQFMYKRFDWYTGKYDFFAREARNPFLAVYRGIEFREALSISGGGLAQLCEDYTTTKKLKGDLDFKVQRNFNSPLSSKEQMYCINDVIPLSEWSYFIFQTYVTKGYIPLTRTGIQRREVNELCRDMLGKDYYKFKEVLYNAFPDEATYATWSKKLFRGGYVHSNRAYSGYLIEGVMRKDGKYFPGILMYDITSSYPARMLLCRYPGKFLTLDPECYTFEYLDEYCADKNYAFVIDITIHNMKATTLHSIESSDKCIKEDSYGIIEDNGRIVEAECAHLIWTDYDWECARLFYDFKEEDCEIHSVQWAKTYKLPPYVLNPLKEHYKTKARLKKAGIKGIEYTLAKSACNAYYGLLVTRLELIVHKCSADLGWYKEDSELDFDETAMNQVLLFQWGCWVASASRAALLKMTWELEQKVGKDYYYGCCMYSDTDSLKVVNDPRIPGIIEEYNHGIAEQLKAEGLTEEEFSDLGMFDFEMLSPRAKFLGAKRYMCDHKDKKTGEWVTEATIAGLPKVAVDKMDGDPYEAFKPEGMVMDANHSFKTTHAWWDHPTTDIIDGVEMHEEACCAIYDIPFSLKLNEDYYAMLMKYMEREDEKL